MAVDRVDVGKDESVVKSSEVDATDTVEDGNEVPVTRSSEVETTVPVMDDAELARPHFRPGAAETAVTNSNESGRTRRVAKMERILKFWPRTETSGGPTAVSKGQGVNRDKRSLLGTYVGR